MLNELKKAPPCVREEAERGLLQQLSDGLKPERLVALALDVIDGSRGELVEACRRRLIEVVDREAWQAAFSWVDSMSSGHPPVLCNAKLGTACTMVSLLDLLRSDDEKMLRSEVLGVSDSGYAFPLPQEEVLARLGPLM